MCKDSLFVKLVLLALATGEVTPVVAQSTHLSLLETSAPPTSVDAVSAAASAGWAGAWVAPSADPGMVGAVIGVEKNEFASITTAFFGLRFRAGALLQITAAQTTVADLFDPLLIDRAPGLSQLGVSAALFGVDAVQPLGSHAAVSLGVRFESDELLGERQNGWVLRASGTTHLPFDFTTSVSGEWSPASAGFSRGNGRVTAAVTRPLGPGLNWGAGGSAGDVWAFGGKRLIASTFLQLKVADLLRLSAAVGAERDPFQTERWNGFFSLGFSVRISDYSVQVRRRSSGEVKPTGIAAAWNPDGERRSPAH